MGEIIKLPYLIDAHVHFRTPGQEYKEDFVSGSRAALAGGVATVLDMPNNSELITTGQLVDKKIELASKESLIPVEFYLGTLGLENQNFQDSVGRVKGLKIYMNNTTGGFTIIDPINLDRAFKRWDYDLPILLHAEGGTLSKGLLLAQQYNRKVHVCHVSLKQEVDLIKAAKNRRPEMVTAEVTPHHLAFNSLWTSDPYYMMKPPLSKPVDQAKLWEALNDGTIDIVATDHAPHARFEKQSKNPPFGVTGLETMLPMLLAAERMGWISMDRIIEVTHTAPLEIFGLKELEDTYVEVDRNSPWEVRSENLQTGAKSSPFEGRKFMDKVKRVILEGKLAYQAI